MPRDSGFQLHYLDLIVNVHWGGGLHFLYSGADGMFGSDTGEEWVEAPTAVPATSLAWVDDVWVAAGPDGCWRSEDGGKTWESSGGPAFLDVVACKPRHKVDDEQEKEQRGIFAGWKYDEDAGADQIYSSHDLGKSWFLALSIPNNPGDGDESQRVNAISGCGYAIIVSGVYVANVFSHGSGVVWVSIDGAGFGDRQLVWRGSESFFGDLDPHYLGYGAGPAGFDPTTELYFLMGGKEEGFGPGGALGSLIHYSVIYATGSEGSFGGENEVVRRENPPLSNDFPFLAGGSGAAGGDGKFVGTYLDEFFTNFHLGSEAQQSAKLTVHRVNGGGAQVLLSSDNLIGASQPAQIGPVVFKPGEEAKPGEEKQKGTFACIAFDKDDRGGGVWVALPSGDGFARKHIGRAFPVSRVSRGGIGVGSLSWLGSTSSGNGG